MKNIVKLQKQRAGLPRPKSNLKECRALRISNVAGLKTLSDCFERNTNGWGFLDCRLHIASKSSHHKNKSACLFLDIHPTNRLLSGLDSARLPKLDQKCVPALQDKFFIALDQVRPKALDSHEFL